MSIGVTAANQPTVLILSILAFVLFPVGFWLISTIIRLIGRIFGLSAASPLPILVLFIAVPGALLAGSLLIDRQGQLQSGQVIDKQESVSVHGDGSWADNLSLVVRYSPGGEPIPPFHSKTEALLDAMKTPNTEELATIQSSIADYDRLRLGDSVDLRVLQVGNLLSLVRLADQSTRTLVPWGLLEDAAVVVGLFIIAWQLRKCPVGYGPLVGLVLIAMVLPLGYAYQNWRNQDNSVGATQHAVAVVGPVTRITEIDIGNGTHSEEIPLIQPYDIVQLRYIPAGAPDAIVAVDAVDANARGASQFVTGSRLDVGYPLNDPRAARISGQTRTHYFKTTLTVYLDYGVILVFFGILAVGGALFHGLRRRALRGNEPI